MNKSLTQANQNAKQISNLSKYFFTRFNISSALKASNTYKKKIPVVEIFQYLFLLIFITENLMVGRNTSSFGKDTVYRFIKII